MEQVKGMTQYLYLPQMWYGLELTTKEGSSKMKDLVKLWKHQLKLRNTDDEDELLIDSLTGSASAASASASSSSSVLSNSGNSLPTPAAASSATHNNNEESNNLNNPPAQHAHVGHKSIVEQLGFDEEITDSMRQKCEEHQQQLKKQRVLWIEYIKKIQQQPTQHSTIVPLPTLPALPTLSFNKSTLIAINSPNTEANKTGPKPILQLEKTKQAKRLARNGVPNEMRGLLWQLFSGSRKKLKENRLTYRELINITDRTSPALDQIERDLNRTFPGNEHFQTEEGIGALRRVLIAYSWWNMEVGYCQSMNFLVALLLLYMNEEEAFWMVVTIIEDLLPPGYYSGKMIGVNVDTCVFKILIAEKLPKIHQHFQKLECEISHLVVQFFLCIFINALPLDATLRVWDSFIFEGGKILFRVGLALLHLHERALLKATTATEIYQILQKDLCHDPGVISKVMHAAFDKLWIGGFSMKKIKQLRAQFEPQILSEIAAYEEKRLTILQSKQKNSTDEKEEANVEVLPAHSVPKPIPETRFRSRSWIIHSNDISRAIVFDDYNSVYNTQLNM